MSYEQWLAWVDESTQLERVDGEVIVFIPPRTVHALLAAFLLRLLGEYVDRFNFGQVIAAPFEMRLGHSARASQISCSSPMSTAIA